MDGGNISALMVCEDSDFQIALAMVKVLLHHTEKVFEQLVQTEQLSGGEKTQVNTAIFRHAAARLRQAKNPCIAQKLGISVSTAERQLQKWCICSKLLHPKGGEYGKPK